MQAITYCKDTYTVTTANGQANLTAQDGLSNPTSVAVRRGTVYVPSAAYLTMKDPNLLLAHLARS